MGFSNQLLTSEAGCMPSTTLQGGISADVMRQTLQQHQDTGVTKTTEKLIPWRQEDCQAWHSSMDHLRVCHHIHFIPAPICSMAQREGGLDSPESTSEESNTEGGSGPVCQTASSKWQANTLIKLRKTQRNSQPNKHRRLRHIHDRSVFQSQS